MTTDAVLFNSGIPSNFEKGWPIELEGGWSVMKRHPMIFATNENFYQAEKAFYCDEGTKEMYEDIAYAATPGLAKQLGRRVPFTEEERLAWDSGIAVEVMLQACIAKFSQHLDCRMWLGATGNRPLVEHRRDPIWGDNLDGTGRNLLGKTLELARALLC